jgi:thiamine biosynthesis lipoprotein
MPVTLFKPKLKKKAHHHHLGLMGCKFVLTAVHENPQIAWDALRAGVREIERIEALITSWRPDSQTGRINQMAGIQPVKVDSELFELIRRSLRISQITKGAFDISGTLSRYYWDFNNSESQMPSKEKIEELRVRINYHHIILDEANQSVFLREKGMKIGFGAIGKGYAALRAKMVMVQMGIDSGLVNASGDLMCWGSPLGKDLWEIKIPSPENRDFVLATLNIPHGSVVTSGGYEKFTMIEGKRYSHIIDPRTGFPVEGLKSVSIVCPNPELGDALATSVSVLGLEKGLNLINRMKGIECLLVDNDNQVHYSNKLRG